MVRDVEGLSDEYEVLVDKVGDSDRIRLRVELLPEVQHQQVEVEDRLENDLRLKTNLRFDLEFHDYGSLPRYEVKARRFKDLRKEKTYR